MKSRRVFSPLSYIKDERLRTLLLRGYFEFPMIWKGDNNDYKHQNRIFITPKYLFELSLFWDSMFAREMLLSGILDIDISILQSCLTYAGAFNNKDPIWKIIKDLVKIIDKLDAKKEDIKLCLSICYDSLQNLNGSEKSKCEKIINILKTFLLKMI